MSKHTLSTVKISRRNSVEISKFGSVFSPPVLEPLLTVTFLKLLGTRKWSENENLPEILIKVLFIITKILFLCKHFLVGVFHQYV